MIATEDTSFQNCKRKEKKKKKKGNLTVPLRRNGEIIHGTK